MAFTILNFATADTGGLELLSASSGSPTAEHSGPARSGKYCYKLDAAEWIEVDFFESSNTNRPGVFYGMLVDALPGSTITILELYDTAGTPLVTAHVDLNSSGDLIFIDQAGTTLGTATAAVVANKWFTIEWLLSNISSGDSRALVDNTEVFSVTNADHINVATGSGAWRFDNPSGSGIVIYIDDVFVQRYGTGAGAIDVDEFGDIQILSFQKTESSNTNATPDFALDGTVGGNDLENSTYWKRAGQRPYDDASGRIISYDGAGALNGCVAFDYLGIHQQGTPWEGSAPGGPLNSNLYDHSGTIVGAGYLWYLARSGGGSTTQHTLYGKFDPAGVSAPDMTDAPTETADWDITTGFLPYKIITTTASEVPTKDEYFVMGISKSAGGQDLDCSEMQAFLFIRPATTITITDLDDGSMTERPALGATVEI